MVPNTYLRRQPFIWYQYWWPGILLCVGCGFLWATLFYSIGELGWGLFIGLPWMLGALLGYRDPRSGRSTTAILKPIILTISAILLVLLLIVGGFAGMFCGLFLLLFFIPLGLAGIYFGILSARILAGMLKQTAFSQREYLPMLLVILLLPGGTHVMQLLFARPIPTETIQTSRVVELDQDRAWDAWMFYEEVDHEPPLLRLGLPRPSHVEGRINAVGDREVCVYTGDARLVKRATAVVPGQRLAFDVIEQHHFENHSIRLVDGQFEFAPLDASRTQVTLTTRYEPLLRPRLLWQPIERKVAHQLHNHVLEGMQEGRPYAMNNAHQGGRQ